MTCTPGEQTQREYQDTLPFGEETNHVHLEEVTLVSSVVTSLSMWKERQKKNATNLFTSSKNFIVPLSLALLNMFS